MGLDISAYSYLALTEEHEYDPDGCWEAGHINAYVEPHFPHAARDIAADRCYTKTEATEEIGFRAGSYSGYGRWREELSRMALDMDPEQVWAAVDKLGIGEAPFIEQICFSDCEGVLGPSVCAKLASDYDRFAEKALKVGDLVPGRSFADKYNDWRDAMRLGAQGGMVRFH